MKAHREASLRIPLGAPLSSNRWHDEATITVSPTCSSEPVLSEQDLECAAREGRSIEDLISAAVAWRHLVQKSHGRRCNHGTRKVRELLVLQWNTMCFCMLERSALLAQMQIARAGTLPPTAMLPCTWSSMSAATISIHLHAWCHCVSLTGRQRENALRFSNFQMPLLRQRTSRAHPGDDGHLCTHQARHYSVPCVSYRNSWLLYS